MSYFRTLPAKFLAYFLYGIAFKLLYGWFVAETFNLPAVSLTQSWGIAILFRLMGDHFIPRDAEDKLNLWWHSSLTPCIGIGLGWALHQFGPIIEGFIQKFT